MKVRMRELTHNVISCRDCLFSDTCTKDKPCEHLAPVDEDDYAERLLEQLKKFNTPSPTRYLGCGMRDIKTTDDRITPTYAYHRRMINDCLRDIRAGRITYAYTELAVKDILRFEPNISLSYKDGVFYIRKVSK